MNGQGDGEGMSAFHCSRPPSGHAMLTKRSPAPPQPADSEGVYTTLSDVEGKQYQQHVPKLPGGPFFPKDTVLVRCGLQSDSSAAHAHRTSGRRSPETWWAGTGRTGWAHALCRIPHVCLLIHSDQTPLAARGQRNEGQGLKCEEREIRPARGLAEILA